jgi:stearoyl-CoA desaturase (delta-9 desaturase)
MSQQKGPINWPTAIFLGTTFAAAVFAVPLFAWHFGVRGFDVAHFLGWCSATGLAITVGYHRLFAHRSFEGAPVVRYVTALLGAASFENSVLTWASEHRYHHKHVDEDGFPYDPYNVKKGFFHAHIGWLLRTSLPELPRSNVKDLAKDPFLVWQDRYIKPLMFGMGLGLPTLIGLAHAAVVGSSLWLGAAAGFLYGGILRVVVVQHATFFINSLAHTLGSRPFDSQASSRDSGIVAVLTFGEGYHNFHHTFQADYRNGVRPWHFDPGKWVIWLLSRVGLAWNLKRVPAETINLARLREKRRRIERRHSVRLEEIKHQAVELLVSVEASLEELNRKARALWDEYRQAKAERAPTSRERLREIRRELRALRREFRLQLRTWESAFAWARAQLATSLA